MEEKEFEEALMEAADMMDRRPNAAIRRMRRQTADYFRKQGFSDAAIAALMPAADY